MRLTATYSRNIGTTRKNINCIEAGTGIYLSLGGEEDVVQVPGLVLFDTLPPPSQPAQGRSREHLPSLKR